MPGEEFKLFGRDAFLISPPARADGRPTPWVFYAPTLPGTPGPEEVWMFTRFLAAGIAIAGINIGEAYGSPAGRAGFTALYRELTQKRNLAPKAILLARSRGGLMLYNWASENPAAVAGIAGVYPVCSLLSYPGLEKACPAYGLSAAELGAQLAQHNPLERLAPLAQARVPLFHIHGDVDVLVPLEDNSGELAKRYRALGGSIELLIPPGQGHNMWEGFFQCQPLVDFVIACAAR
jgi:dipeptidyl aminopeptidase/acylaminoacyl peptidase